MTDTACKSLLPQGLRDILPPDADHEAAAVATIMACFTRNGYLRVKPPLIEFETSLLAEAGAATASHCFRVMDPMSHGMMGLRADMTPQVSRIAKSRLVGSARPVRLSYSGDVLRVKGSQLNPDRQSCQAGLELIGSSALSADAEVLLLAVSALTQVGVPDLSVDLSIPTLVPMVLAQSGLPPQVQQGVMDALNNKDATMVRQQAGAAAPLLLALLEAAGPMDRAVDRITKLDLPAGATHLRDDLLHMVGLIRAAAPQLALTLDPVECLGFKYHTGLAFTIFSRRGGGELGRGGRYLAGGDEPATGATLFLDGILAVAAKPAAGKTVFVPCQLAGHAVPALQADGWITIQGLEPVTDVVAEAQRLRCGYVLGSTGPEPVSAK